MILRKELFIIAGVVAALGGSFYLGHSLAEATGKAELSDLRAQYDASLSAAHNQARVVENTLRADIDKIQEKYSQLEEVAAREAAELNNLVSDLRDGSRRLSIQVRNCAASGPATSDSASSGGSGPAPAERAELDPEAAETLIAIARDGDRYIRERNACVEAYEAVRRRFLSPQPQ